MDKMKLRRQVMMILPAPPAVQAAIKTAAKIQNLILVRVIEN
jgi:hypothetical protein